MPNLFRTPDGKIWKANARIPLWLADGTTLEEHWAGSAKHETLDEKWRSRAGSQIAQTEIVAAIASRADDNGEMIWGDAPPNTRLLFVVVPERGKGYSLARMVTTAATKAQQAHFRHDRSALFGHLKPDGSIAIISPLDPPPPPPPAQGELF
ncbi:hypothetical protein CfE428DRAFT_6584 [Chthoniobacter flavus Ellin428]|uniref:Uncharacterized protein n=1 Tax=Chthoniobacter flavus Ellin428 TaxID=497964 RepID=B4DCE3_9BACT|nr:hypothetical protein [Chthoniobacter flavus]EDY15892.1 hypothetical protein CfE428DRAFT_6584 [Chthoniobacter flavus Ellin428]TCO87404.1 hypothetical protein EV701_12283 [Chthoniobacter flavus]